MFTVKLRSYYRFHNVELVGRMIQQRVKCIPLCWKGKQLEGGTNSDR